MNAGIRRTVLASVLLAESVLVFFLPLVRRAQAGGAAAAPGPAVLEYEYPGRLTASRSSD